MTIILCTIDAMKQNIVTSIIMYDGLYIPIHINRMDGSPVEIVSLSAKDIDGKMPKRKFKYIFVYYINIYKRILNKMTRN